MLSVVLSSVVEGENQLLYKKLVTLADDLGHIHFDRCRPSGLTGLLKPDVNLLVFNAQHFGSHIRQLVSEWRYLGYLGPVMVLTKVPDVTQLKDFEVLENVVVLDKPYENKDLMGISRKLLSEIKVFQRKFRRFPTNQAAHLESYKTSLETVASVDNISLGGACIRGNIQDVTRGDILKVEFSLDKMKKSHVLNAKVVWTTGRVGDQNRTAGLAFVPREEIYNELLG